MDIKKGFLRLTWFLSLFLGIIILITFLSSDEEPLWIGVICSLVAFALVWVIYALIRWIVMGFTGRGSKDKSNP